MLGRPSGDWTASGSAERASAKHLGDEDRGEDRGKERDESTKCPDGLEGHCVLVGWSASRLVIPDGGGRGMAG